MRRVERMTQHPPNCLHCGRGSTADPHGRVAPALDLERDVGWGDSTYICEDCCSQIALLFGFISPYEAIELRQEAKELKQELHDARAEMEERQRRMDRIVAGKQALGEERKARQSKVKASS